MASLNESPEEMGTDSFVENKMTELKEFIKETLSKKKNYEEKDQLFKEDLQHTLLDILTPYERHLRRIIDVYEKSADDDRQLNHNTFLRDSSRIDGDVRREIVVKIDQHLNSDYVPPTREEIERRQRELARDSKRMANAYYKTPEGKQYKTDEKERKTTAYLNRQDPLIRKMRQGEDISEELKALNERIAGIKEEDRKVIERAERRLREVGDIQLRKVTEDFDLKRATTKRLYDERPRQYPSNASEFEKTMQQINENEEHNKRPIRVRTEDSIIYMKTDYLRTGKLPDIPLSNSENEESGDEDVDQEVTEPVPLSEPLKPELDYDKLYVQSIIHHKISVPFTNIGNNMEYYFKKHAVRYIEGKCRKEGFIRPNSVKVVSYSTGLLQSDNVVYDVIFSADACYPCEDMIIKCKIVNITKIGIRAIISEVHNPIVLFISREHNANKNFEDYEEGNVINIKVIGHRFELNDEYISVIGEII